MHGMRQRYMSNILQFNKQQIEDKARRKQDDFKNFTQHSHQINQEAINELVAESNRNLRKKEEDKYFLKESYDRQMREKAEREKMEKEKDVVYAYRQRERLDYEEDRRMFEISKMFNRVTYQATPSHSHRRSKTEGYDEHDNPERNPLSGQQQTPKNLNNIQINLLPPPPSQQSPPLQQSPPSQQSPPTRNNEGDSLDNLNYSFHKKDSIRKY
jgi:hypothetical protein